MAEPFDCSDADAFLIAAGPTLLEAAQQALLAMTEAPLTQQVACAMLRDAICKAKP